MTGKKTETHVAQSLTASALSAIIHGLNRLFLDAHLAERKYMLRISTGREGVHTIYKI